MPQTKCTPESEIPTSVEGMEDELYKIARSGARRLLQKALEAEIEAHVNAHRDLVDEEGHRTVVRNGHAPERSILTGVGPIEVKRPRVDERKAVKVKPSHEQFSSGILPRFWRRTPTVEGLAVLYLKGISTNDFDSALKAIYGDEVGSLSASTVSRLKEVWYEEYQAWRRSALSANQYAYIWADGIHFNVRVEEERSCVLVVVGAKFNGERNYLPYPTGFAKVKRVGKRCFCR